ncbi:MAG: hypothetical protein KAW12_19560 [Candidatus Aminicenantes bacterium]|nr:hypothetical protein [Candidatus Aminicenantes bacterium]
MEAYKKVMWGSITIATIAAAFLIFYLFFTGASTPSQTPPPGPRHSANTPACCPGI